MHVPRDATFFFFLKDKTLQKNNIQMVSKCFYVCSRVLGSGFATAWLVEMYLYIITSGRNK